MKKDNLISPLTKVKGLGSAGTGTSIWLAQRVSAIALVPLAIYFVYFMIKAAEYKDIEIIASMFTSPFATMFLGLFISVGLYHGNLGMREIIEDYVHCSLLKKTSILLLYFFSLFSAIAGVCAVFVLHLSTFSFN